MVVGAVLHLLREDVAGVATPGNVEDLERAVKDPFVDVALAEFHVMDPLGSQILRPVDGGLIIVADSNRGGGVREGDASALEVA